MIDGVKDGFAHHMTMIQGPSPNQGIKFRDQFSGGQVSACFDARSYLEEKRLHILLRWGNEELGIFSSAVFANGLPQEVKALLDMRDDRLLW
jgi:hypothetical protein